MSDLTLRRVSLHPERTYGVLIREDAVPFALTLEREADDNRASEPGRPGACIPAGTYVCKRVRSPRFGDTFEVRNVPGRSHILFHKGNIEDDSRGCILVGESFNPVLGKDGIVASAQGFSQFLALNADRMEFTLTILDP